MSQKTISLMRFDNLDRAQRIREQLEEEGYEPVLVFGESVDAQRVELHVPLDQAADAADYIDELEEYEDEEWEEETEQPLTW